MKTLKEYADMIQEYASLPAKLADLLVEMTHDYGEVCDSLIPVERVKMAFWLEHKKLESDKPVSDKTLEMMWIKDGQGELQRRMELYKKALEKMMSNLKAILREKEHEARNQV